MDRRDYLQVLGAGTTWSVAGCSAVPDTTRQKREHGRDRQSRGGESDGQASRQEITLPGEPSRTRSGRLPVLDAVEVARSRSEQFQSGLGRGDKNVTVDEDSAEFTFRPEHSGTGRASGYATGTYRTAWTAPETGKYQLKATFHRWGGFYYDLPPDGSVMTSFDVNVQIANYDRSKIVANQKFPQSLQSSNKLNSDKLAEFLIETGVTALLSYSLGLSLVARVVLGQIVDGLIELDDTGNRGGNYDVAATVQRGVYPQNIGGPFEVTAGTTVVFEISPMVSWSYRFEDFEMSPSFGASFDLEGFWVKQLD